MWCAQGDDFRTFLVPLLWYYEVGNGLVMAYRRKRIAFDQIDGFLTRLKTCRLLPRNKLLPKFSNCQSSQTLAALPITTPRI